MRSLKFATDFMDSAMNNERLNMGEVVGEMMELILIQYIEKVYVTTLVTPMGLASSFNGGILKIIAKKWANFENSINHHKSGLVWSM